MTPFAALLRFHLRSGVRLAMRAGVPAAALLTAGVGLSESPGATLQSAATNLATASQPPIVAFILAVVAGSMAAWAVPRILHGTHGWVRHLPAGRVAHRRALIGATVITQVPVAIAWLGLWVLSATSGGSADLSRLLALPIVMIGVAFAALPSRVTPLTVLVGLGASALSLVGGWIGIGVAPLLLLGSDPLLVPRPKGAQTQTSLKSSRVPPVLIPWLITYRALGSRSVSKLAVALFPLAAVLLFVNNNADIQHGVGVRLATGGAVAMVLAGVAEALSTQRPPWRWARSLPWSAAQRLQHDAAWLAVHVAPLPFVFALLVQDASALLALFILPLLVVRAAGAPRRPVRSAYTWPALFGEGLFVAGWLGVTPWTALPAILLIWPAWRQAVSHERNLDVSRWSPQDSLATGDPVSWRGH